MVLTHRAMALTLLMALGASSTFAIFDALREVTKSAQPGGVLAAAIAQRVNSLPSGDAALLPLVDGKDALEARPKIIERAERGVDLWTFLIKPDLAGRHLAVELYAAAEHGGRVHIATNSDAATNHPHVHGGYAPYRDGLLAAGVEFVEVRADAPALTGAHDEPDASLFAKLVATGTGWLPVERRS